MEASAELGPAWAHVVFGADGIVYFDPFRLQVRRLRPIDAGITIDVWIGEITISISIGAKLHLEGPKFHGKATFSIGPVGVTVPFGDTPAESEGVPGLAGLRAQVPRGRRHRPGPRDQRAHRARHPRARGQRRHPRRDRGRFGGQAVRRLLRVRASGDDHSADGDLRRRVAVGPARRRDDRHRADERAQRGPPT